MYPTFLSKKLNRALEKERERASERAREGGCADIFTCEFYAILEQLKNLLLVEAGIGMDVFEIF